MAKSYDERKLRSVPPIENVRFVIKDEMQYDTLGDYQDNGIIELYGGMNKLQRIMVGMHELFEFYVMKLGGVSAIDISRLLKSS